MPLPGRGGASPRKAVLQEVVSGWKVGSITFQHTTALISLPLQDSVLNLRTVGPRPAGAGLLQVEALFPYSACDPRDLELQSRVARAE